jgi:hypothetical protein
LRPSEPLKRDVLKASRELPGIERDVCKVSIDVLSIKIDVKNLY